MQMHELLRAQMIAGFKRPERMGTVSPLPQIPVGEILKRQLREMIAARMEDQQTRAPA